MCQFCQRLLDALERAGTWYGNPELEALERDIRKAPSGTHVDQLDTATTFALPNGGEFRVHAEDAPHRGTYLVVIQTGRGSMHIEPQSSNAVRIYAPDAKPQKG